MQKSKHNKQQTRIRVLKTIVNNNGHQNKNYGNTTSMLANINHPKQKNITLPTNLLPENPRKTHQKEYSLLFKINGTDI